MANENKPVASAQDAVEPLLQETKRKLDWSVLILKYNSILLLMILIFVSSFMSPHFFSYTNLVNVLRQQTNYMLVAMGLLICMAAGGVDLALAAAVGISNILCAEFLLTLHWGIMASIIGSLVVTAAIGALSGWLVAYLGMAPFIVTLCQSFNLQGWAYFLNRGMVKQISVPGRKVAPPVQAFLNFCQSNDPVLGLPMKFEFVAIFIVLSWFIMTRTKFGRLMIATGSNPIAARLAGIDTRRYRMAGFAIASFACAMTGVIITGATASASSMSFTGDYTMIAMAAAIIGGSSLEGGGGSVPFTVVGIFVMGLINNIMQLANIPAYPQYIVKAAIIILAIYMRTQVNQRLTA